MKLKLSTFPPFREKRLISTEKSIIYAQLINWDTETVLHAFIAYGASREQAILHAKRIIAIWNDRVDQDESKQKIHTTIPPPSPVEEDIKTDSEELLFKIPNEPVLRRVYEYCIERCEIDGNHTGVLNYMGNNGWEHYHTEQITAENMVYSSMLYYFRRLK
jgi:hypothetical protein